MPNASEIKDDGRFIGLFISRSGAGKTAAALSFPGRKKIYDLDGRVRGGLTKWIDRSLVDYEYFPPKDASNTTVVERLNRSFDMLQTSINMRACPYETIIFDSFTWAATDLLLDAIPLTHAKGQKGEEKGRTLGPMAMQGPEDYKFQSVGMWSIIAFLKSLPIKNIICTAHIVNKWGKNPSAETKYEPNIIVGEQLSLTDKLAENIPSSFDHIVKFKKEDMGNRLQFTASFHGELARTAYDEIPYGDMDITGVSFYDRMHATIASNKGVAK